MVVVQTAECDGVESETGEIVGWVDTTLGAESLTHFNTSCVATSNMSSGNFFDVSGAKCLDQDTVYRRLVCRERK